MKFMLFDRDENYTKNIDTISPKHTEEINGEEILEFSTLDTTIEKGYRVVFMDLYGDWKEFIVQGIEEIRSDEEVIKEVFCESSFYETMGDFVEDRKPRDVSVDVALNIALAPTRWEVGIADDLGINSINIYRTNSKEAAQNILERWGGEMKARVVVSGHKITRRYLDVYNKRGNNLGKRFTYRKDLEKIKKITHREDVITALYGFGKGEEIEGTDGYGRRIDFAELNNGKMYVENNKAKEIWGRNNQYGTKSHVFGKVEFDDCEDKAELLDLTKEKLEEISSPLVTYKAKVIDLKAFGFEHEGTELGDVVTVIDKEFDPELRIKARVVKIARYLLEPEENEVILGNFVPGLIDNNIQQQEYINNFRGKQGVWDRSKIIGEDGNINAQYLENLIGEMNERLNSQGGYVYLSEDGKGLTTYNKPIDQNPTMAIQLLGGAFRIANRRKPNGDFDWRTFGDGDGFVADMIVAGVLQGGKVRFDLTNGTLFIGDDINNFNLLFDGQDLHIRGDFATYQNEKKAIEMKGNSIYLYDWEGTPRLDHIGRIFTGRRNKNPDEPTLSLAHERDAHIAMVYKNLEGGYSSYMDFDNFNRTGTNLGYGVSVNRDMLCKQDVLFLNRVRLAHNATPWIQKNPGNPGLDFIISGASSGGYSYKSASGYIHHSYLPGRDWPFIFDNHTRIQGNFIVTGSKNAAIETKNHGEVLINSYETAEYYNGDLGSGKLGEDGLLYVYIDDIFDETVNTLMNYHIIYGKCGPGEIYTYKKYPHYFIVKGEPGLKFTWELKAKRDGYEYDRLEAPVNLEEEEELDISYLIENEKEQQANEELEEIIEQELTFDLADYVLGGDEDEDTN